MTAQNRNPIAQEALYSSGLRHPLLDTTNGEPTALDCLDAINRSASVIELVSHLDLEGDGDGLSPRAASGYWWIQRMLRDTLLFATRRLACLHRQGHENARRDAHCLSALAQSLTTLDTAAQDHVLDAAAMSLQVDRSAVDRVVNKATKE